jgi:pimeloyl-ACP methyl ester carboxylesterase
MRPRRRAQRADFDVLGEALSSTHRVLAVDMPGRGESDWLADPNDYVFPTYLTTLTALVARSGAQTVDWVGTSMGGLLGIVMAAQPKSPIARLVVNDVGPAIEPAAIERIRGYFGTDPTFATYAEIEQYVRTISEPFGPLTATQWEHVTRTNVRQRPDGRWGLAYDPGIAVPFRSSAAPPDLWGLWDAIRAPTLALRGAKSGPAVGRHRRRDGQARPQADADRVSRCRPRSDAALLRPDRSCPAIHPRLITALPAVERVTMPPGGAATQQQTSIAYNRRSSCH